MPTQTTRNPAKKHAFRDGKRRKRSVSKTKTPKAPKPAPQSSVPLAAEMGMWHAGVPAEAIVDSMVRSTHLGIEWGALILRGMTHARYDEGVMICATEQRRPDSPCARGFLLFVMEILRRVVRTEDTDYEFKVVGRKWAWWGKSHEPRTRCQFELDQIMEDKCQHAELHGLPAPERSRVNRRYVRKLNEEKRHQQHGVASRIDRCVRTVGRYAAVAKKLGLFQSQQPPRDSKDAVMPRLGSWAYPEWVLLKTPPEGLLKRLRKWWGETTKAGKPVRVKAGEPRRIDPTLTVSPRGPPQARLQAAQPDEDLRALLGLSLTELDDFEQLCGI